MPNQPSIQPYSWEAMVCAKQVLLTVVATAVRVL